jgi:hypothetical protein
MEGAAGAQVRYETVVGPAILAGLGKRVLVQAALLERTSAAAAEVLKAMEQPHSKFRTAREARCSASVNVPGPPPRAAA